MRTAGILLAAAALVAAPRLAHADDAYCDQVEGVAAAQSALLFGPELFGSFGYVDQLSAVDVPDTVSDDLRVTAGVKLRLGGIYQGFLTRQRAKADCRRHQALDQVQGVTTYRALEARMKVLDAALDEADRILAQANSDLDSRAATAAEATATRLRVDELRELAAKTRSELGTLPAPVEGRSMARALSTYYQADADVEKHEGALRRAQGWDVSVRLGYDKFASNDTSTPFFAVAQVSFNLGWLLQGPANKRAASGRRRLVQEQGGALLETTETRLRATLEIEVKRAEETGVLVDDLEKQLAALKRIGGGESRRYRQTVWFDWVKMKAEHEYYAAHVQSLREILGEGAQ